MRAVLNRRSLGLLVLALAMASIAVRLGFWQMDVARSEGRERAIAEAASQRAAALRDASGQGSERLQLAEAWLTTFWDGLTSFLV